MTEFEPILLKKIIYNNEFFGKVLPIIEAKYFAETGNQELFKLIKKYYNDYRNIPSVTELVASVKNVSNSEIRTEIINALQNVNKTEEVANLEFMCDEAVSWVKDAMYMESLRIGSDGLMKKDDDLKKKAKQIMEDMSKVTIDSDLGLDFDNIEEMLEYYAERNFGIRTQHKELNKRLGPGFLPSTLSIILAASGVGKSLLMTDLISGMIKASKNVLLVSLEMADKEIMKRVHANALDLPINSLTDLSKTEGELADLERPILSKDMIQNAYNRLKTSGDCGKFFVKDYPAGGFSALMLEQLVESYRIEKNIKFDAIFIDYLGIMKSDLVSPSAGLYSYVKSIGEEVRASAKKLDIPIISASQLNRSAQNSDDADNTAVSDSIGTLMTADFMLFLLQDEEMKERKEIVCKCTKNRFTGRTDTWMMGIDYDKMRFHDLIIQTPVQMIDATDILDISNNSVSGIDDDFGIITQEKQEKAEKFAKSEINEILAEDVQKIQEYDKHNTESTDPFKSDIDDIFAELGI